MNDRGLIEQEFVDGLKRTYSYSDPRGFLSSSQEGSGCTQGFHYDSVGLMTKVTNQDKILNFTKTGSSLSFGATPYLSDPSGRVTGVGSTHLTYNALGRVGEVVNFPKPLIEYGYDEKGIRIFKKMGGLILEIYQDDSIFDGESLYEPLKVSGTLVDLLRDGKPMGVTADRRGSIILNELETLSLPSAYGERTQRSEISRIADYAL